MDVGETLLFPLPEFFVLMMGGLFLVVATPKSGNVSGVLMT